VFLIYCSDSILKVSAQTRLPLLNLQNELLQRYHFLQKHNKKIRELLEFNCLLQCNVDSITGKYGKKAKKLMKWMLKHDLVQFVATDTHSVGKNKKLEKSFKKLRKIVGEKEFIELTSTNPLNILKGKEVQGNLEYLMEEERNRN